MEIRWYGHTAFEFKYKTFSVIVDPFDEKVSLGKPSWNADIVTLCNRNYQESILPYFVNTPKIIDRPGEYEINDFFIYGIRTSTKGTEEKSPQENNIFKFEYNNQHILHLSHLGEKLSEKQLEQIGRVDILLLALGSEKMLNLKESKEMIEDIDPRVIIPVDTTLKNEDITTSSIVQDFIKTMGKQCPVATDMFQTEKHPYNPENMDIVCLQRTTLM